MEKITSEELISKLEQLEEDQVIFIPLDKDISNEIQLLDNKIKSYDNLFASYINNTSEEANEFNMKKFTDIYAETFTKKDQLVIDTLIKNMGTKAYKYLVESKMKYYFDLVLDYIKITK